jgi:hypothetical protein
VVSDEEIGSGTTAVHLEELQLRMWPQIIVIIFMVFVTIMSIILHGKTLPSRTVDAKQMAWVTFWFALILGAGGFWDPR